MSVENTSLLFAVSCAVIALLQRRNGVFWFLAGWFGQWVTLGLLLTILPLLRHFAVISLRKKIPPKSPQAPDPQTIDVLPIQSLQPEPSMLEKLWYFLDSNNKTIGPMSFQRFQESWRQGLIAKQTLIWNEALSEWKPFKEVFPRTK